MPTSTPPLAPGQVVTGPLFNEPMRVETIQANGPESWMVGLVGTRSERFRKVALSPGDFKRLSVLQARHSFDGDGGLLRLGLQAYSLGIAYEFDPYFGLSISRVDPLPHQLEAVYDYLLKVARPHPEREAPDVRRLKQNPETETKAMQVVMDHERALGRQVYDVSARNLGYDVTSLDLTSGELGLIEVKGIGTSTGTVLLTPNERRVAEDRRDCYWLYVVTDCDTKPRLREPIPDPARLEWREVTKVAHYYLSVDAMTRPPQTETLAPGMIRERS
jgi:hypothetical protein